MKIAKVKPEIAPEVIEALRVLRGERHSDTGSFLDAVDILDNAGIFAAIDEATGYDVESELYR